MVIYCITNTINNKRYVGQTRQTPQRRWSSHKSDANTPKTAISYAMRKHGVSNFQFEIIDESANNLDELNDLEELYISMYDTFKGHGYNSTSGGGEYEVSEKTKQKMRLSWKHPTNETRKKMKEGLIGHEVTKETREKLRQANLGKKLSEETKNKIIESLNISCGKKVIQIDLVTGKIINTFRSISEAARKTTSDASAITKVCKGKYKYCNGFIWKYANA